ncbi:acyltransferase [Hymenobacter lutimineralis]|uniref:Acyltransferase n=1 Tax=Hymenobacter lutimineralis TaxID=2606448 RepID=A0A5D6UXU9_9BACT|nr:acyltransferase [Hymenobacter lutimineralis]TYZ07817.1 acyltransferase [Hymenobacter lutimineralis]
MNRGYLPALTGFRAVAALLVFLFHYRTAAGWLPSGLEDAWRALASQLNLGVSLFFTLSGFLLGRLYYAAPWPGARRFWQRRFARIYPLFFLLTTLQFLFHPALKGLRPAVWWPQYLLNVSLLKGFSHRWHLTGIGPAWSLTVEECFYLLLPVLLWLAYRFTPRIWAGCALVLALLGLGLSALLPPIGWLETPHFTLLVTFFGRSAEFLIGAAFALLPAGRLTRATSWGLLLSTVVLGLQVGIARHYGVAAAIDTWPGMALNNWGLPVASGLLLYGLATEPSWLSQVLSSRPLQVLGRSSYAFYLLHLSVVADFIQGRLHRHVPQLPAVLSLFLLLVTAAVALHYLVEKPVHRWLTQAAPSE